MLNAPGRAGIVTSLNPASGGEYQYSLSVLRSLDRLGGRDFTIFARPHEHALLAQLSLSTRFRVAPLDPPGVSRFIGGVKSLARRLPFSEQLQRRRRGIAPSFGGAFSRPASAAHFRASGLEWMLYTAPNAMSFEAGVPFAMPIHDIQHKLQPHFPEVTAGSEWERREYLFGNAAKLARMILVDSEIGKEDVLNAYGHLGLTGDRVGVLPYLPPDYLRAGVSADERQAVRRRYDVPERYLFYPAQFWPHKNHVRLVEAVGMAAARHKDISLVLVGSCSGDIRTATYEAVCRAADRAGISARIRNLGYVPNEHMAALYADAVALVFPTFFGPTNIPILEAWALGVPVMTSQIRGAAEQVGDAALLVDPSNTEAMAAAVERLWRDDLLRKDLIWRGRERLARYDVAQFDARLSAIIERIAQG